MVYTEYSIEKAKARETNKVLKYNNDINYIEHFKMIFEKEKVKLYPISGNFEVKHFDNFLKVLPMIHPVKVENKDNIIVIK